MSSMSMSDSRLCFSCFPAANAIPLRAAITLDALPQEILHEVCRYLVKPVSTRQALVRYAH